MDYINRKVLARLFSISLQAERHGSCHQFQLYSQFSQLLSQALESSSIEDSEALCRVSRINFFVMPFLKLLRWS
ncbi:MAG: hypothetical protein ACJA04_000376 [Cellvibrionaceae bacterium]|jgi:hypothetical protein